MFQRMNAPVIFDGRNLYEPWAMERLGFTYHSIGRPAVGKYRQRQVTGRRRRMGMSSLDRPIIDRSPAPRERPGYNARERG